MIFSRPHLRTSVTGAPLRHPIDQHLEDFVFRLFCALLFIDLSFRFAQYPYLFRSRTGLSAYGGGVNALEENRGAEVQSAVNRDSCSPRIEPVYNSGYSRDTVGYYKRKLRDNETGLAWWGGSTAPRAPIQTEPIPIEDGVSVPFRRRNGRMLSW